MSVREASEPETAEDRARTVERSRGLAPLAMDGSTSTGLSADEQEACDHLD
jgi:hypothetical protein